MTPGEGITLLTSGEGLTTESQGPAACPQISVQSRHSENFLDLSGAQGVAIFVRLSHGKLSRALNLNFLALIFELFSQ